MNGRKYEEHNLNLRRKYNNNISQLPGITEALDEQTLQRRTKRNTKIVKMFKIIVLLFYLLNLPNVIYVHLSSRVAFPEAHVDSTLNHVMNGVVEIIESFSTITNVFIYARMFPEVKQHVHQTINKIRSMCIRDVQDG